MAFYKNICNYSITFTKHLEKVIAIFVSLYKAVKAYNTVYLEYIVFLGDTTGFDITIPAPPTTLVSEIFRLSSSAPAPAANSPAPTTNKDLGQLPDLNSDSKKSIELSKDSSLELTRSCAAIPGVFKLD